jgi:hypothetical protein
MRSEQLTVVTAIFNPIRWQTRYRLYEKWLAHMLESGVRVVVVESAFGDRPFVCKSDDSRVTHVGVRSKTLAWNKENLCNIGFRHVDTPYVAWIDADVRFHNTTWAADTVEALQQYPVVQPWAQAIDLGPEGEPMFIKGTHVQTSFAKVWHDTGSIDDWLKHRTVDAPTDYSYPHPGYAWAARRDVLERLGGLIEASGLGAGDHQMAMGFIGHVDKSVHSETHPVYQHVVRSYGERAYSVVQGMVGYVRGTIEHHFHGSKDKRKYQERWSTLIEHEFNPVTDLRKNLDGVLELAGNKPRMAQDFDRYFRQRMEDATTL